MHEIEWVLAEDPRCIPIAIAYVFKKKNGVRDSMSS